MKKVLLLFLFLILPLTKLYCLTANAGPDKTGNVGEVLTFDGSLSQGNIISYYWDFGDGNSANGVVVNHSYTQPGTYTVTLIVIDNEGNTASDTLTVTIAADNTPPTIEHTPVTTAVVGNDILITAEVSDNSGISSVTLYWKLNTSSTYSSQIMEKDGSIYKATIAGSQVTSNIFYYIKAVDNSTNQNTAYDPINYNTNPYEINITQNDTIPPTISLIDVNGLSNEPYYINSNPLIEVLTNEEVQWCKISNNSDFSNPIPCNSLGNNKYSCNVNQNNDGNFAYYIYCNDTSGNANNLTNCLKVNVTIDRTAPNGNLTLERLSNGRIKINYSYFDQYIDSIKIKRNNTDLITINTNLNQSGSGIYTDTGLQDNVEYTYYLILTDKAGNVKTINESIIADNSGPSISCSNNGNTVTITISDSVSNLNQTVEIKENGNSLSCTPTFNGKTMTCTLSLSSGTHNLQITAWDILGHNTTQTCNIVISSTSTSGGSSGGSGGSSSSSSSSSSSYSSSYSSSELNKNEVNKEKQTSLGNNAKKEEEKVIDSIKKVFNNVKEVQIEKEFELSKTIVKKEEISKITSTITNKIKKKIEKINVKTEIKIVKIKTNNGKEIKATLIKRKSEKPVIEYFPKEIVENAKLIKIINGSIEILEEDPIIKFTPANGEYSYIIEKELSYVKVANIIPYEVKEENVEITQQTQQQTQQTEINKTNKQKTQVMENKNLKNIGNGNKGKNNIKKIIAGILLIVIGIILGTLIYFNKYKKTKKE